MKKLTFRALALRQSDCLRSKRQFFTRCPVEFQKGQTFLLRRSAVKELCLLSLIATAAKGFSSRLIHLYHRWAIAPSACMSDGSKVGIALAITKISHMVTQTAMSIEE